ncbi:MAG: tRNA (adenosine(37)-N6)-dimethylallyltransferase MiaA, partial [Candidatus Kapabacteria bacterium]|nr:tRNA (adenosine(37)-N6)-dimethylallyltransferase MiaA [Candidatus Kapabacteria bacterium]
TASGKTSLSISLSLKIADSIRTEILSADSRQLYKFMDIGTAKPTIAERGAIPHHFIDTLTPDEPYSAGKFKRDATDVANKLLEMNITPLVVGGTGLYVSALCEGMFEDESTDYTEIRSQLQEQLETQGIDRMYQELQRVDKTSADVYADKNPRRVLRALEYFLAHGEALSVAHKREASKQEFTPLYFAIDIERDILYKRINQRSENMWKNGLVEETQHLLELGYSPELNALNTVGYKEALQYIGGEISFERGIELTAQNTRRYAKRQLTWLRNRGINYIWLRGSQDEMQEQVMQSLSEHHLL